MVVQTSSEVNIALNKFFPQIDVNMRRIIIDTGIATINDNQVFVMLGKMMLKNAKQTVATNQTRPTEQVAIIARMPEI